MPYGKFDYRVLLHTAQHHVMEAQHILAVAAFIFLESGMAVLGSEGGAS